MILRGLDGEFYPAPKWLAERPKEMVEKPPPPKKREFTPFDWGYRKTRKNRKVR